MANKTISIFINAHQPYFSKPGITAEKTLIFCEMAETYIPILRLLDRLAEKNMSSKLSFAITPSLCALFSDNAIQNEFCEYLNRRIELAKRQLSVVGVEKAKVCEEFISKNTELLADFENKYGKNLTEQFFRHYKAGHIDLLATTATPFFVPFLEFYPSVVDAQFEAGIMAFRDAFDVSGDGFFVPHQFFSPGMDRLIQLFGFKWTCVDKSAFLAANPFPRNGIFSAIQCPYGTLAVPTDSSAEEGFFHPQNGYTVDPIFMDVENDDSIFIKDETGAIGSKLPLGLCFTDKSGNVYNREKAAKRAKEYAEDFWKKCKSKLSSAAAILKEDVNLSFYFNASTFGHTWAEGTEFLEELLRLAGDSAVFTAQVAKNARVEEGFSPAISTNRQNFGEDFLDKTNSWALRHIQKTAERMVELSKRFSHDSILKERILSVAARQTLLMQDACLSEMIKKENFADSASEILNDFVSNFSFLFDSLGSKKMNTEWLIQNEAVQRIFPGLNYRIFTPKV